MIHKQNKSARQLRHEVSMLPTMGITKEDFVEIPVNNVKYPPFEHIGQEWKSNLVGYCRGCKPIWVIYKYEKPTKEGEKYSIKLFNPVILTKKQIEKQISDMAKIPVTISFDGKGYQNTKPEQSLTKKQITTIKSSGRKLEKMMNDSFDWNRKKDSELLFNIAMDLYGSLTSKQYFSVQC